MKTELLLNEALSELSEEELHRVSAAWSWPQAAGLSMIWGTIMSHRWGSCSWDFSWGNPSITPPGTCTGRG